MSDSNPPRVAANDAEHELPIDDEIAALLDFEPVPRKVKRKNGWFPHLQREFIHRLALCGSPGDAARQMRKNVSGIEALYREEGADSFRAAWDGALELNWSREEQKRGRAFEGRAPGMNVRSGRPIITVEDALLEDTESERRIEEARNSISNKLLRARRLYLFEIADSPGKRAAFEILTELPIDWDKARNMEEQPDEPFRHPNMRRPDMLLTAENGWLGEMAHGPDKKLELRRALDEHRAAEGLEPVDWDAGEEDEEEAGE